MTGFFCIVDLLLAKDFKSVSRQTGSLTLMQLFKPKTEWISLTGQEKARKHCRQSH